MAPLDHQKAEVEHRPRDHVLRVLGTRRPGDPSGIVSSTRTGRAGGARPRIAKPYGMARTPSVATCLSLAVGVVRAPTASATSCPWAQVSISRAVTKDAADMSGPYQGSLIRGSSRAKASRLRALAVRNQSRT